MNEQSNGVTGTATVGDMLPLARALRTALKDLYDMQRELGDGGSVITERYHAVMDQARIAIANSAPIVEQ